MRSISFTLLAILVLTGCRRDKSQQPPAAAPATTPVANAPANPTADRPVKRPKYPPAATPASSAPNLGSLPLPDNLVEARQSFKTTLLKDSLAQDFVRAPTPPSDLFLPVIYEAAAGNLQVYVTPDPLDGNKHPAIIWITGGDCNSIGKGCWQEGPRINDQSACQYRKAGIVMMFPSLRGGFGNPGQKEGFLGEVDDVIAAAAHLARLPYVDPDRIYLGGHSTGGTLVLLVSESTDRFRAVFSFGPADDVSGYDPEYLPFDKFDSREFEIRSPGRWLKTIKSPTFVFEGTVDGNLRSLQKMAKSSTNPNVHFIPVRGANHFSILAPTNHLIAEKILGDDGPDCNLTFTEDEVSKLFGK